MKLPELALDVEIPNGVTVDLAPDNTITVKGKNGETKRMFHAIGVSVSKEENKVYFRAKKATKKEKRIMGTFQAHVRNMVRGVTEGHLYRMKICSGHFPMTVTVKGKELSVKNFLGEKVPRTTTLLDGVDIKIEGSDITIESPDIEKAGIVSSRIELLTFISKRDRRVFQDGIFMTEKASDRK